MYRTHLNREVCAVGERVSAGQPWAGVPSDDALEALVQHLTQQAAHSDLARRALRVLRDEEDVEKGLTDAQLKELLDTILPGSAVKLPFITLSSANNERLSWFVRGTDGRWHSAQREIVFRESVARRLVEGDPSDQRLWRLIRLIGTLQQEGEGGGGDVVETGVVDNVFDWFRCAAGGRACRRRVTRADLYRADFMDHLQEGVRRR